MFGNDSSSHHRKSHLAAIICHRFSLEPSLQSYSALPGILCPFGPCKVELRSIHFTFSCLKWEVMFGSSLQLRVPQWMIIPHSLKGLFISNMKIEQRWEQFHVSMTVSFLSTLVNGTVEAALKQICLQQTLDCCLKQNEQMGSPQSYSL